MECSVPETAEQVKIQCIKLSSSDAPEAHDGDEVIALSECNGLPKKECQDYYVIIINQH